MVGSFGAIMLRSVVISGNFSIIGCSLLASVLLSVFKITVIGTNLTVVVSCFADVVVVGRFVMLTL